MWDLGGGGSKDEQDLYRCRGRKKRETGEWNVQRQGGKNVGDTAEVCSTSWG